MLIFPTVATGASGSIHNEITGKLLSTSRKSILINIDGLGDASIGVNSQDKEYSHTETYCRNGAQDAEPMTFMFTKSIVASGDGIQKAILYLENN